MRIIYTLLASAVGALTMTAGGLSLPTTQKLALTPSQSVEQTLFSTNPSSEFLSIQQMPAKASARVAEEETETQWSEWSEVGSGSFDETVIGILKNQMQYWSPTTLDWDGSFTLMQRKSLTDDSVGQLRLDHVFNDVNIVLDWDIETNAISCVTANASTGIAISDEHNFEWDYFHLNISGPCGYYPAVGKIVFNTMWLNVDSLMGLNLGAATLTLDEAPEFKFNVIGRKFMPSSSSYASVSVERSEQVKFYRVAVFSPLVVLYYSDITDLMLPEPTGNISYKDYTSDYFIVNFDQPGRYYAVVVPFGDDGRAIGNYNMTAMYSNYQGEYSWTPAGTGKMTDILGHTGLDYDFVYESTEQGPVMKAPPVARDVELEVRTDNPSIFRVKNPFGKDYPYFDHLEALVDPDDDFYLNIDTTDPSRVNVTYSLTGFYADGNIGVAASASYQPGYTGTPGQLDEQYGSQWGKYADRRIAFPMHSVMVNNTHILYTPDYDLELLLPGYIDYSLDWQQMAAPDAEGNYALVAPAEVTTVLCGALPEATYQANINFPERLYAMVAEAAKTPATRSATAQVRSYDVVNGMVTIPAEDIKPSEYGTYVAVIVPVDAAGEPHSGIISRSFKVAHPDDNWTYIGEAVITENSSQIMYYQSSETNTLRCPAYENNIYSGFYRLDDPYLDAVNDFNMFEYPFDKPQSLYIDATDPERVLFVSGFERKNFDSEYGFNTGFILNSSYGPNYINTLANYNISKGDGDKLTDAHYAKLTNNCIVVEGIKFVFGLPSIDYIQNSPDGLFMVELPETVGVEDAVVSESDSDAQVEYFNLQGVKVAKPQSGIYICRKGAKTTKVFVK